MIVHAGSNHISIYLYKVSSLVYATICRSFLVDMRTLAVHLVRISLTPCAIPTHDSRVTTDDSRVRPAHFTWGDAVAAIHG